MHKFCVRGLATLLIAFIATSVGAQQQQPAAASQPGLVLVDRLVGFFARSGIGDQATVQPAINELMQMAKQSLADRRIDQPFFDRYARMLRLILLASIPDQGEVLQPTTSREFNSFIRDILGRQNDASGARMLGDLSTAMATEIESLRKIAAGAPGGIPDPRATPTEPVRVGPDIKPPERLKHVEPVYPAMAKTAKVQGLVMIDATIGKDGKVTQAKVVQGVPLLDEAALAAVKQWVYAPTLIGGVPVDVVMTVTVSFAIR
jgi:protein TonB